ncbi:hypothetical protein HY624_03620 [Candidatus Uhrbacteria bacterium]|nr:hypothetical protein [Candidatus Uhrbacteria bacterium]
MADTIRPLRPPIEHMPIPEHAQGGLERGEKVLPTEREAAEAVIPVEEVAEPSRPSVQSNVATAAAKSALLRDVEKILEEEIGEVYFTMNPREQEQFKKKGEATAHTIEGLLATARATAYALMTLLKSWLKLIPGVSSFFLEQEAKIKTDKLLRLQHKKDDA